MRSVPSGILLVLGLLLCLVAPAGAEDATANLRVVKIHADGCGTCVKLNPTWEALRSKHGDAVDFVVFDVTDDDAKAAAAQTAKARDLEAVLATYGGRTGTILVLGPAGGEPVAVLKGETDVARYDAPIAEARES